MEELPLKDVIEKLKTDQLCYNQFYNSEIESSQHYSIDYYSKYGNVDNLDIDQKLKLLFTDIEVYKCDLDKLRFKKQASGPINSICFYDSQSKYYYLFALVMMTKNYQLVDVNNPKKYEDEFKKELLEAKYIKPDENIKIYFYIDEELKMLENMWSIIHQIDPVIMSGFNFDGFDLPYIYYRLKQLYNDDMTRVNNTLSKFGIVKAKYFGNNNYIQIPEYPIADIRRLYIPRSEGGLNYGKSRANYSLDAISSEELGLTKIDHSDMSFDQLYEKDPIKFYMYNVGDVALTVRLNDKLKHIELHNMLRRDMKTPFTSSLIGSSSFFSSMFNYELKKKSIGMRWGLLQEQVNSIGTEEIQMIEKPKEKSIKWNIDSVDEKTYQKIMNRFVGAYVKEGLGKTLTMEDGILVDLDATALYPSMMKQNNISFDSYFGRVLDPNCYKFIDNLSLAVQKNTDIMSMIKTSIFSEIKKCVERLSPQNKNNHTQYLYFMFMKLLKDVISSKIAINEILIPKTYHNYLLLKSFLLPLLDLMVEIKKVPEYNEFAYEYIIRFEEEKYSFVYIVENENESMCRIKTVNTCDFSKYLIHNQLNFNLSGALFKTHESKTGMLNHFLTERLALRKQYKTKRDTFPVGSDNYDFYDRRQLAMKINANSSYGLTGMSGFLFSNKQLAMSTTLSGRLCLKISQACGELYLNNFEKELLG